MTSFVSKIKLYSSFIPNQLALTFISTTSAFPKVQPYNFTQLDVLDDRELGALLVRDNGTTLSFSVDVVADPCPDVVWCFNGTRLGSSNETFAYNNACMEAGTKRPNWTFTLNVLLTAVTSGKYSASFTNVAGTTLLPMTYFTIPGMFIKGYA